MQSGLKRKSLLSPKATAKEYANWVAATAKDEFPIAESHSEYIRWAIKAGADKIANAAYWGVGAGISKRAEFGL